jgi:putative flippase GtrA
MTKAVVTSLIWTGINCLLLYTVFYLDHRNPDSIPYLLLSIPVGLINCASIFGILNGFIFLYVLNQLHSLSGAMTN